jgi:hypothetical protein
MGGIVGLLFSLIWLVFVVAYIGGLIFRRGEGLRRQHVQAAHHRQHGREVVWRSRFRVAGS